MPSANVIDVALDLVRVEDELRTLQADMESLESSNRQIEFRDRFHALLNRQNVLADAIQDILAPEATVTELISIVP